jgi:hypothetical protein
MKKLSAQQEALQRVLDAGQGLSNVCFNLSGLPPDTPLAKRWILSMRSAWRAWDSAFENFRKATRRKR